MVRRADERTPILQRQGNALAYALIHRHDLPRDSQFAISVWRKKLCASCLWEALDWLRCPVGEQDGRPHGDAGRTTKSDGVETKRVERLGESSVAQVVGDD